MKKVVVTGISDGQGAGAFMDRGKWRGVVLLRPWRAPDGKIHSDTLHVRLRPLASSDAAMKASARVRRKGSLRMEVEFLPKRPNRLTAANLVGRADHVKAGPDLAQRDAKLGEVVTVRDPYLGRLHRPAKSNTFVGSVRLLGRRAMLTIWQKDDHAQPQATIARASSLIQEATPKLAAVPMQVARRMLKLARHWQEDDGRPPITLARLERQLRLTAVSVPEQCDRLELDFSCGQVFADHGVMARVSAAGRLLGADIC
jgi:hypothetical protein